MFASVTSFLECGDLAPLWLCAERTSPSATKLPIIDILAKRVNSPRMPESTDTHHHKTCWPHAPTHRLAESGTYFVTCSTYKKQHFFRGRDRVAVLHRGLLAVAKEFNWQLEAWAVFSNHYHLVAHSPPDEKDAESLPAMFGKLHSETARWVNRLDSAVGRQVWYNYRETHLTIHESYYARLNYTHQNAAKHGLVADARLYPWCSAAWLERNCTPAQVKMIQSFKIDRVKVYDGFEPSDEW